MHGSGSGSKIGESGSNGTGGLLIIYATDMLNNSTGTIHSNGLKGGNSPLSGGGGSGAGSINIFVKNGYLNNGFLDVEGGLGGTGGIVSGGKGGTGSISVGKIVDGTYVSEYTNY